MGERRQKLVIMGRLPSFNEYIGAERGNRYRAARMKKKAESRVIKEVKRCRLRPVKSYPVTLVYHYYCPDRRTDKRNVSAMGSKVVEDALQTAKILRNDGWSELKDPVDRFYVDKKTPRVEVEIIEQIEEGGG